MASEPVRLPDSLRFGDELELDLRSYELRRSGRPLKLERIPMELLLLLLERRGQLVTREHIIQRIWGKDVFLDTDNSINAAIRKIRQVLKDDPERPQYVQTVTGRGYRFIAPTIEATAPAVGEHRAAIQIPAPEHLIGRKISHYRILQVLGGGGMGVVYGAEDLKLGRRVAMKFLPDDLASDPMAFERLRREARAASSLDHPNICAIYELGEHEGQPFIAMQLLEGQTLREWSETTASQDGPQRLKQLLDVAIQIADGLDAAHQKAIIHRDIKPANIFITSRGEAKILDFGVAKFLEMPKGTLEIPGDMQDPGTVASPTLSLTVPSMGTPSYLSPEQIKGETLDVRTDLFSFGLVLYEVATGQRAFGGSTAPVVREAVLNQPAVPLRELKPDLPPGLEKIVSKALEKDRVRRYQSARELRIDLEGLKNRLAPRATRAPEGHLQVVAGMATVMVLLGLVYWVGVRARFWHGLSFQILSSEAKARRSVAVLGFKNLSGRPDEEWISAALAEMLSTELAAGQKLRAIPGENVARMKLDLSLPPADSYGRETLSRIRNNLSTDLVVLGSYLALGRDSGGRVRIDLQLQDANEGETVAVISQEGTETNLADLVSRSGTTLRQTLGIGGVSAADTDQVRAAVPANPESARLYTEGLVRLHSFDALGARDLLEKAIASDPSHALSHSALAESWSTLGYDAKAQQEAKKAFDLSGPLSRADRLLVEGRYRVFSHDFPAAVEIYRTLVTFFPDDLDYGLLLASSQLKSGHANDALATIARLRNLPGPEGQDVRIDVAEASTAESLGDYRRSLQVAEAAVARAEGRGSRLVMARAKEQQGWAWDRLGDADKAITAYSEARVLWIAGGNNLGAAAALQGIGTAQYDKGDLENARKSYEDALKQFHQIGAMWNVASCSHNLAVLFFDRGELQHARERYEDALRIQRELNDERGVAADLDGIGDVLLSMGDLSTAVRMKEQALQAFRKVGDKKGESVTLENLGSVLFAQGDLPSAKRRFEESIALKQEIGYKRGQGFSLMSIAGVLLAEDHLNEARADAERALVIRQELKDEVNSAQSRAQLSEIALQQGKVAEAESLARMAATALDVQNVATVGSQCYAVLTRALLAQGKLHEAKATADRAIALSQKSGDLMAHFEATLAAAAVNTELGRVAEARQALEGVRDETSRHGYANYQLQSRLGLGELELRSGQAALGRARLRQLQKDAKNRGFLLLSRRAAANSGT